MNISIQNNTAAATQGIRKVFQVTDLDSQIIKINAAIDEIIDEFGKENHLSKEEMKTMRADWKKELYPTRIAAIAKKLGRDGDETKVPYETRNTMVRKFEGPDGESKFGIRSVGVDIIKTQYTTIEDYARYTLAK